MGTASLWAGVQPARYSPDSYREQETASKKNEVMKYSFRILVLSLLFVSCKQDIKPLDIAKINGYWEIEKVVFDEAKDKDYGLNESYDYFEIAKNKGFRKKVMPQLDGTFLVNNTSESVVVRFADDKVLLDYSTQFMKWSEELISISDSLLVLKNSQKIEYHYKKTGAINILGDGKKVK
jgi:hypothetical protein